MSRTRTLIIALVLAALLPAVLAHLTGCERTPDDPVYGNPFDPESPEGGDGLQVRAEVVGNNIKVSWTHHRNRDIAEYILDHRTDQTVEWTNLVDTLLNEDNMTLFELWHELPEPNRTHYYIVQALTADGEFSLTGYATPAAASAPPLVFAGLTNSEIPSRYLDLKIVTGEGDSIRVADNPGFTGAVVVPTAAPGDSAYVTWDYGLHAAGDTFRIYAQSFTDGGYASDVYDSKLTVKFEPEVEVLGGVSAGTSIKTPYVVNDLVIDSRGVEQMRFAADAAALATAPWIPGADVHEDFVLQATPNIQSIWCEFQGDFGFDYTKELQVRADLLTSAGIALMLPTNRVTTHTRVGVISSAAATEMRFTDGPDFTGVPWRPFATPDSVDFTGTPGPVMIYGQFRNDWTDSPVVTDSLIFTLLPLDIYFVAPADGAQIEGGQTFEISGRAAAADGVLVRSVEVDKGDGLGYNGITNQMNWTTDWSVPVVTEATQLVLRARVTDENLETATSAITVTVLPPAD
ncbi:MAG: hypothetical protein GY838_09390 [bacterium]|nr:hypothetical protein [bacterium]